MITIEAPKEKKYVKKFLVGAAIFLFIGIPAAYLIISIIMAIIL